VSPNIDGRKGLMDGIGQMSVDKKGWMDDNGQTLVDERA